jgi:hypothetical protein
MLNKATIILFITIHLLFGSCSDIDNLHSRPSDIPESTYYLGGIDGGVWVDTFRINESSMQYLVYSECGELIDTCYLVSDNNQKLPNDLKRVVGYNGVELVLKD